MKAIALFIAIPLVLIGAIVGIGSFLGPDDLRGCDARPNATEARCQKADAIVAISGGDTRARTAEAIRLYHLGWANRLIFSGAAQDADSPSNARAMQRQAIESGVPATHVVIEELAQDTTQNALNVLPIAQDTTLKRIIVVTSAYHQRRTSMEFHQAFGEQAAIINHPVSHDADWSSTTWWLTPRGWWLALGELVKISIVMTRGY